MDSAEELSYRVFTAKSENDKAINSLKGLLLGISLDKEVHDSEIIELNKWVEKHKALIQKNPFREFMQIIQLSINNGIPNNEVIEDLYWLCQKYEEGNYYYNAVTADLQTLQGICHGILADGKINDKEIYDLNKWLGQNEHLTTYYPYDELRSLLLSITSDYKVDEEERLVLQAYFNQFVKLHDSEMDKKVRAETSEIHISGLCTSEPDVDFDGKIFCVTGVLNSCGRNELLKRIENLGGIPSNTVTKKTDYLIVGDNGNPAWAFACYGRKVEKAISMRKEGYTITLIHEFDFFDIIEDFNS
jgi:hypothetical protein